MMPFGPLYSPDSKKALTKRVRRRWIKAFNSFVQTGFSVYAACFSINIYVSGTGATMVKRIRQRGPCALHSPSGARGSL